MKQDIIVKRMELLDEYCRQIPKGLNDKRDPELTVRSRLANFIGWMTMMEGLVGPQR